MNITNRTSIPPMLTASKTRPGQGANTGGKKDPITEEYAQAIRDYAKRDAQAGTYMSPGYIAMEREYMAANVSPDRKSAMAQLARRISLPGPVGDVNFDFICEMLRIPYKGRVQRGLMWTTAEAYNENGEQIVAYHSGTGGWQSVPTDAEEGFWESANVIYRLAYQEARAERNAARGQAKDAYTANMAEGGSPAQARELTEGQAASLAQRYDVHALSRSGYGKALGELRDAGAITAQDFSIGYAGTAPRAGAEDWPEWPLGERTADFPQLFADCEQVCSGVYDRTGDPQARDLAQAYGRLHSVFAKLAAV